MACMHRIALLAEYFGSMQCIHNFFGVVASVVVVISDVYAMLHCLKLNIGYDSNESMTNICSKHDEFDWICYCCRMQNIEKRVSE